MADHLRKQIRIAIKDVLTGLPTTGANVHASRVYPLQSDGLPALLISNPAESVAIQSLGRDRMLERMLGIEVRAAVKASSGYEETVDQIVKEVELALAANQSLGSRCKYVQLRQVSTELSGDGEKPLVMAVMLFDVPYYTTLSAPDVPR